MPVHLRDASYQGAKSLGHGKGYLYPHDYQGHFVKQNYLPEGMKRPRLYRPSSNGYKFPSKTSGAVGEARRKDDTGD